MTTLPDLFDRLAEHGEHAGGAAVVERAQRAARERSVPLPALVERARQRHRLARVLVAAVVTVALVAVPLAVRLSDRPSRPSREPSGPAYSPPAPATAAQLAALHWSRIAAPPISVNLNGVVAWAGSEVVVVGPAANGDSHGAAAAYSPTTGRWRVLPRPPLRGDFFFKTSWTWTGRELVLFPQTLPDPEGPVGEAYSPRTNSWRVLARAPICTVAEAGVAWTGTAVVVAGGYNLSGSRCTDENATHSAFYNPRTDRWTVGPPIPLRAGDRLDETRLVWIDGRVLAVVASQRTGASSPSHTTPTLGSTVTSTAGSTNPAKDPNVHVFTLRPGERAWQPLGDLTQGIAGEAPMDRWQPFAAGSRAVFPPALRFCGEGDVAACSIAGVQPGSLVDIETGKRIPLAVPTLAYANGVDAMAFTGSALFEGLYAGSGARNVAWDVATGRRVSLPNAPERVMTAVWTGHELFALAFPANSGPMIALRLG